MSTQDLVVTADIHLRPGGAYKHRRLDGDAEYGLEQIVEHCEGNPPQMLAILGDVFEAMDITARSPEQHAWFRDTVNRVRACSRFGYLLGNHDRGVNWPGLYPGAVALHERSMSFGPRRVYGLDFTPADRVRDALETIPAEVDTLLAHQAWGDLLSKGTLQVAQAEGTWLSPNITAVITGDYHRTIAKQSGPVAFYSPGPVCMQELGEPSDKAFMRLSPRDDGWDCTIHPLRSRPVARVILDDDDAIDSFLRAAPAILTGFHANDDLPQHIRAPILDIRLGRSLAKRRKDIAVRIGDGAHLFLRWTKGAVPDKSPVEAAASGEFGLRAALCEHFPPGRQRDLALRLEASHDPRAELAAIIRESTEDQEALCISNPSG